MEILTAGAIAFLTLLLKKTVEKTGETLVDKGFEQGGNLLKMLQRKSPETGSAIEKVTQNPELIETQPEDYGMAVLVEKVKEIAKTDPEIRQEVEAIGEMARSQPEVVKVIENWRGINIKGGSPVINNPTFKF